MSFKISRIINNNKNGHPNENSKDSQIVSLPLSVKNPITKKKKETNKYVETNEKSKILTINITILSIQSDATLHNYFPFTIIVNIVN